MNIELRRARSRSFGTRTGRRIGQPPFFVGAATLAAALAAVALAGCGDDEGNGPTDPDPDPTTGTVEASAVTTGDEPDPDGYTVTLVGSGESQSLGANGTATFSDVEEGDVDLELSGVADNCAVDGSNPRTVSVVAGENTETSFTVRCVEPPPTVDGVRDPGEWDDATSVPAFTGATFLYQNDDENLYLALEVDDPTFTGSDRLDLRFDNARDGSLDDGEDNLRVDVTSGFADAHFSGGSWSSDDSQQDGAGAAGGSGGTNFFEIVHPLDSGDPDDFSLSTDDLVGYCIIYFEDGTSNADTTYPSTCNTFGSDLTGFAELSVE